MKCLFITAAIALAPLAVAGAAVPNIYACRLTHTYAAGQHTFGYSLNTAATSVDILLYDLEGNLIATCPSDGLAQGDNVFTTEITRSGTFTWAVRATAEPTDGQTGFIDAATAYPGNDVSWSRLRGLDINDNPMDPCFGYVYASGYSNKTAIDNYSGLIVLDNCLKNNNAGQAYNGGLYWKGSYLANDACVSENGDIYLSDWDDYNSGVYVADATDLKAGFKPVFSGTRAKNGLISTGDVQLCGSVATACAVGMGENTVLYTFDEDLNGGGIFRYDIGTTIPWEKAPSKAYGKTLTFGDMTMALDKCARLRPDRRGGVWFCNALPGKVVHIVHIDANGEIDFAEDIPNQSTLQTCALAVSHDGSRLAVENGSEAIFYNVDFDESGVPSIERTGSFDTNDTSVFGLAFDYAMNLYVDRYGKGIAVYAMPKAENICEVPGPDCFSDGMVVGVTDASVAPDEAVSAVYTVAGVCVGNDTDALPAGVYIVRTASRAYKIIK